MPEREYHQPVESDSQECYLSRADDLNDEFSQKDENYYFEQIVRTIAMLVCTISFDEVNSLKQSYRHQKKNLLVSLSLLFLFATL